jgi:hypothetical protein
MRDKSVTVDVTQTIRKILVCIRLSLPTGKWRPSWWHVIPLYTVPVVWLSAKILVIPVIHRYVLLPLGLYHEFRGSRFLRNEGSYLANFTASHRRALHKLRSISCYTIPLRTAVIKKKYRDRVYLSRLVEVRCVGLITRMIFSFRNCYSCFTINPTFSKLCRWLNFVFLLMVLDVNYS